jgi:DNA-binding winged helix-turn-helix (wHTH) protein
LCREDISPSEHLKVIFSSSSYLLVNAMCKETNELYEFGAFRVDVGQHTLERIDGAKNGSLPEKAFQTLIVLIRNSGKLVTKEQLIQSVWPDTIVEDNNLDKCIWAVRQFLGDKPGEQKYIETVRKHGYRFVAEIKELSASPALDTSHKNDVSLQMPRPDQSSQVNALEPGSSVVTSRSNWPPIFIGMVLVICLPLVSGYIYQSFDGSSSMNSAGSTKTRSDVSSKFYWELTEVEQLELVRERSQYIESLIGDEITEIDEDQLRTVKNELDDYVSRNGSKSDRPFEEPIQVIYQRASVNAEMVIARYESYRVPPALGIYQALVESEYHECLTSPTGNVGLFQLTKKTAAKYELLSEDYCNNERQANAAAWYMSDIIADLGDGKSNSSLALLTYSAGLDAVRGCLKELRDLRIRERSYWAVARHKNEFKTPMLESDKYYVPRFFAAAIIGETPQTFNLQTPPLTSIGHNKSEQR